ncbi:MAG TPA: MFS transporter [Terriglobales bacterium]|nr:MFS transporter [Terriglobales bacterium]
MKFEKRRGVNRASVLWIAGLAMAIAFAGSTLPTPLYLLYRRTFGFSEITLTLIYAAYVLGNLSALFFFGRLSDQIGRKKTTWPALAVGAMSTLAFLFATATWWLFVARVLSGFATGLAGGAATAWIAELHPRNDKTQSAVIAITANLIGLAAGPLMAGLLATYEPCPLRLSFLIYLAALVLVAAAIFAAPETLDSPVASAQEISLRPRLGVPKQIRSAFISPAVTAFAILSLVGFYSALVPGLLSLDLQQKSPAVSGMVVFGLFIVAAITAASTQRLKSHTSMIAGLVLLPPSLALLIGSQVAHSISLLILATVLGGVSQGFGYCGSLQVINQIAPDDQRSEVVSSYLIACYLGNSVPVVGIGFLSRLTSSTIAHLAFGVVVAAFAAVGLLAGIKYPPDADHRA